MKYFSDIKVKAITRALKLKNEERAILIVDNNEAELVHYLTYNEGDQHSIDTICNGLKEVCIDFFKKNEFDKSQAIIYLEFLFNSLKEDITENLKSYRDEKRK